MTNNENHLISIVISAFSTKRFDMIVNCINSIFNNAYKNYEIILVIDGNERLKQMMEYKFKDIDKVIVIGNKKDEGPSIARNHGVEIAKGDIIAFIDDDALAPPSWLEGITQDFSSYPDIIVIGGKILPIYNNDNEHKKLPDELLWIVGCTYKGYAENKQFVRNVISANMAVKRDIFNEINFESTYGRKNKLFTPIKQLEDTLFCTKVNDIQNDTVLYDPDIIVYHNVPDERLKLSYIIRRSFSEGMLKAKLGYDNNKNKDKIGNKYNVLSQEQNYLNMLFISIIKNLYMLNFRYSLLLSITIMSVGIGYISETVSHLIEERQ